MKTDCVKNNLTKCMNRVKSKDQKKVN